MAEDLLADVSRMFFLLCSTTLFETIGETLQSLVENCMKRALQIGRLDLQLEGGSLLEAVQGGFELTCVLSQATGREKRLDDANPNLLVLGFLRQTLFEVRGRLIQQIPGFLGLTGIHQRPGDLEFEPAKG